MFKKLHSPKAVKSAPKGDHAAKNFRLVVAST